MLLHVQSRRLTRYWVNYLALGLALVLLTFISRSTLANAESIAVNAEIPPAGLMSLTIYNNDLSEDSTNTLSFSEVQTSDTELFERNDSYDACDIEVNINTNSDSWHLTQNISPNQLANGYGETIDLHWKMNEETSYTRIGDEVDPDILNSESSLGEHEFLLDYALDAPSTTPPGSYTGTITYTLSYN